MANRLNRDHPPVGERIYQQKIFYTIKHVNCVAQTDFMRNLALKIQNELEKSKRGVKIYHQMSNRVELQFTLE